MSSISNLRSEDQFLCSISMDVFTDPVSTPCGHNFCKACITHHWDGNVLYNCPLCKEHFTSRPQLKVYTFIKEMVSQFRREDQQEQAAKPGEVPCDVCTGTKLKALKSWLVCLLSYCQAHLEPHLTAPRLKKHQLMEPVENLEDRMCLQHNRPLELFCRTDLTSVCSFFAVLDHKNHKFVPLRDLTEGNGAEPRKTEAEVQKMIQKRRVKIQEIKESMKISKDAADREKAGFEVFIALMESAERGLKELIKEIKEKQKTAEKQAEDLIKDLEQDISDLRKRSSEVKQLSQSEDHLHLLQSFSFLKAAPPNKSWTEVRVRPPSYEGTVVRAVAQLEEEIRKEMKKMMESELKRVQQSAVDVTLDPDTAQPDLILSHGDKQVKDGDVRKKIPDNPQRFSQCIFVLGCQSFSSGRFYFEVQVKGKTEWGLGVVRDSIDRKADNTPSPQYGYWTVVLTNRNEYYALDDPPVRLHLHSGPEKVGVFVDHEEGLVSFYDVDAAALIYSFTGCCFNDNVYPIFSPCDNDRGKNSAPLIIC